jgi:hypothetical protein
MRINGRHGGSAVTAKLARCAALAVLAATCVFIGSGVGAAHADSAQVTADVMLKPKAPVTVAVGMPAQGRVHFQHFSTIDSLCFQFSFQDDLLDAGEELILDLGPSLGGFGFSNIGTEPQAARLICTAQPEQLQAFRDGKQSFLITMTTGTVVISSITVEATGQAA